MMAANPDDLDNGTIYPEPFVKQPKRLRLEPWDEVVAIFNGLVIDEETITVDLGAWQVTYHCDSPEGKIVAERLNGEALIGSKIAILRTDDPRKPIRIREEANNEKRGVDDRLATWSTTAERQTPVTGVSSNG